MIMPYGFPTEQKSCAKLQNFLLSEQFMQVQG